MANTTGNRPLRNLTIWLRRQIYIVRHSEGKCSRFVLHSISPTQKLGNEITSITVGDGLAPGEKLDDTTIDSYASDLMQEAESYTDGIGGTQSFAVGAIFDGDNDRIVARHAFRCHREEEDDSTMGSEPATATGLMSQLMRHTEAMVRQNNAMFGTAVTTLVKQNSTLSDMVEKFLETRVNELEAAEELISAKHQRDLDLRKEEGQAAVREKMVETAMALLPAVANRAIGKKILPETTDSSLMALMGFADTLTPAQIEVISSAMDPGQRIAFFELLQSIQKKQEEKAPTAMAVRDPQSS